jgi:hypothetical protein
VTGRPLRGVAVLVVAGLVAMACGSEGGSGGGSFDAASKDPFTEEAKAYGLGPQPHDDVTFQPDVVIVSGAGESIRSVTDGGLTWTIDGDADGAADLEPGKIMFVTGRSVGRVLNIAEAGDDLEVTIGPVTLTDVIRDGSFKKTGIVLDEAVEYPPIPSEWQDELDAETEAELAAEGASFESAPTNLLASAPTARPRVVSGGTAYATCCTNGVGAHFTYDQGGNKLSGNVTLTFQKPDADFFLSIAGGKITRAELVVSGGFGTKLDFEAGIDGGKGDIRVPFPMHGQFGFPIAQVLGVPLTFTITQSLAVTTAFGAKKGTIKGDGEFTLAARLAYGYEGGGFQSRVTPSFKRQSSLINSLSGVPLGVMGLLVQHHVKFNVGFSAYVLEAGAYLTMETALGITRGSALGAVGTAGTHFVECQGVGLGSYARFGIGVTILKPVADAINKFLSLFNVRPIPTTIGPVSAPVKLYAGEEVIPDVALCGHTPNQGGGGGGSGGGGGGAGTTGGAA